MQALLMAWDLLAGVSLLVVAASVVALLLLVLEGPGSF